jgi:hypothetical protein
VSTTFDILFAYGPWIFFGLFVLAIVGWEV